MNQKVFLHNMIKIIMMNIITLINYKANLKLLIKWPFKKLKKHQNIWKLTILIYPVQVLSNIDSLKISFIQTIFNI